MKLILKLFNLIQVNCKLNCFANVRISISINFVRKMERKKRSINTKRKENKNKKYDFKIIFDTIDLLTQVLSRMNPT